MMNAIKSSAFMLCNWPPESLLIRSDAVIVCNNDRYDSGKEDIITMLILFLIGCLVVVSLFGSEL